MPQPYNAAQMGDALRNYFGQGAPKVGRPESMKSQQPPQPGYGPVPFQDALKALGPAMDNGQAYTNPQAFQGYQNAARAVGAMYGMQPTGYFANATPAAFRPMPGMQQRPFDAQFNAQFAPQQRMEQRPFDAQFRAQFPGQGIGPAPNPTVR